MARYGKAVTTKSEKTYQDLAVKTKLVSNQMAALEVGDKVSVTVYEAAEARYQNRCKVKRGTVISKYDDKFVVEYKPWRRETLTKNDLMSGYISLNLLTMPCEVHSIP